MIGPYTPCRGCGQQMWATVEGELACPDDVLKRMTGEGEGCRPRDWEPDMAKVQLIRDAMNKWEKGDCLFVEVETEILRVLGIERPGTVIVEGVTKIMEKP